MIYIASWLVIIALSLLILKLICREVVIKALGEGIQPIANVQNVGFKVKVITPVNITSTNDTIALSQWIDRLGKNEDCPVEGIIDSNGYRSYGLFCYQRGTFIMFIRSFLKDSPRIFEGYGIFSASSDSQIMKLVGNDLFQKTLTLMVFEKSLSNWTHWRTTVLTKIGYPPGYKG